MSAQYDHDSSRVSKPISTAIPDFKAAIPPIKLRLEADSLRVYDSRRLLRTLMPVSSGASVEIVYPAPAHPDLTALWSINDRIYFTNNDYRNVYVLPEAMNEEWLKPRILS
jgi:hypothetical protein